MKNKYNLDDNDEYFKKIIYTSLSNIIEGITILVESQKIILNKLSKNNTTLADDNLEISSLLEEMNSKIDSLLKSMNTQEENSNELEIDLSQIKDILSSINKNKG